jgi:predicted alpha/beta hydrolase
MSPVVTSSPEVLMRAPDSVRRDGRDPAMNAATAAAADAIARGLFGGEAPRPTRTLSLPTDDGPPIAADLYLPAGEIRARLLMAPAMGVRRRFYARFLGDLAEHGVASMVIDYRGIGGSRTGRIREERTSLSEWGERDLAVATRALSRIEVDDRTGGAPMLFVGHSVGGQLFGLLQGAPYRAALLVGSQAGYWGHWSGASRLAMAALWFGAVPLFTSTLGYLPMRALGQGENIPGSVAREWATWGRDPRYVGVRAGAIDGAGYDTWHGRLRAIAIDDDGFAPQRAVEELTRLYRAADTEVIRVAPAAVGARRIGHFGWFSPRHRETLWADARAWLLEAAT